MSTNKFVARNGIVALSDSIITGSLSVTNGITGSFSGTATSASYSTTALTASYADTFTVAGTLTAQKLVVQTITSSIVYSSGSNIFGNSLSNTQSMTGSVSITGSLAVNGNITGSIIKANELIDISASTTNVTTFGSIGYNGSIGSFWRTKAGAFADFAFIRESGAYVLRNAVGTDNLYAAGDLNITGALNGTSATFSGAINSTITADTIFAATASGTSRKFILLQNTGGYILTGIESASGSALATGGLAYAGIIGTAAATPLQFYTNGIVRQTITSGGNVGIGTTSPTQPLEVKTGTDKILQILSSGDLQIQSINDAKTANVPLNIVGSTLALKVGATTALSIASTGTASFAGPSGGNIINYTDNANNTGHLYIRGGSVAGIGADNNFTIETAAVERMRITSNGYTWVNGAISGFTGSAVQMQVNGQSRMGGTIILHNTSNAAQTATFNCTAASTVTIADNVVIVGSLSKGSGSFRIEHPLPSLSETHQLVHSFVEAPQADLYYRGKLKLVDGKGQANIDEIATMTEGTFEVLCREVQCFTTNESGWDLVRGKVIGNIIYLESQNEKSTDEISWLVIGERKDKHIMETDWTDENGKVIVEPLKPIEQEPMEDLNARIIQLENN